jgi:hypothetical protein
MHRAAGQRPVSGGRLLVQAPSAVVFTGAATGLAVALLVDWETGCVLVGLAMLLAAGLRMTLPTRRAGALAVRSRTFDAGLLLVLGFGLVLLATSVPKP